MEDRGEKSRVVRMQLEELAPAGLSLGPPDGYGRSSDPELRSARLSPPARTVRLLAARVRAELGRHCTLHTILSRRLLRVASYRFGPHSGRTLFGHVAP